MNPPTLPNDANPHLFNLHSKEDIWIVRRGLKDQYNLHKWKNNSFNSTKGLN